MKTKIVYLLLVFLFSSCILKDIYELTKKEYIAIKIINNSKSYIAYYPYSFLPISLMYGEFYPDTLLPKDNIVYYCGSIPPMKTEYYETIYTSKEIREKYEEKDLLIFFVFSVDTLNKYSWDEIREGYKILKRYDLSIHDLDSINWTITYP